MSILAAEEFNVLALIVRIGSYRKMQKAGFDESTKEGNMAPVSKAFFGVCVHIHPWFCVKRDAGIVIVAAKMELMIPSTAEIVNRTSIPITFQIYPPRRAMITLIK